MYALRLCPDRNYLGAGMVRECAIMRTLIENKARLVDLNEQFAENCNEIKELTKMNRKILFVMDRLRQDVAIEEVRLRK